MKSFVSNQFTQKGCILTSQAHKEKVIEEIQSNLNIPLDVSEFPNGAVLIEVAIPLPPSWPIKLIGS